MIDSTESSLTLGYFSLNKVVDFPSDIDTTINQ